MELFLAGGPVYDTEEESTAIIHHNLEELRLCQMWECYLQFLGLEADFEAGGHAFTCPAVAILPYPPGLTWNFSKSWFHLTVQPRFCYCDNVSTVPQNEVVGEVTNICSESSYDGSQHGQVTADTPAPSPSCIGLVAGCAGRASLISVLPARTGRFS